MANVKINKRILEAIREKTNDVEPIRDFLTELLDEESRRPGSWWFKEYYKKKIEEYSQKWGEQNED